jgi:phosphoribosyl-ATP pyrophosphohydrolase
MSFYPEELYRILTDRLADAGAGTSYTRSLAEAGAPRMIRKLVEEAGEVAGAFIEEGDDQHLIEEVADLLYHTLVLLAVRKIDPARVQEVLESRHRRRESAK